MPCAHRPLRWVTPHFWFGKSIVAGSVPWSRFRLTTCARRGARRSRSPEDASAARQGLRRPQLGAVHAVLGDWTTGRYEPATVVMPTGTGKTETMVAFWSRRRSSGSSSSFLPMPCGPDRLEIRDALAFCSRTGVIDDTRRSTDRRSHRPRVRRADAAQELGHACNVIVTTPNRR